MTTVTVGEKSGIRLPGAVPGEVYRVEQPARGQYLLVLQKGQTEEDPFPAGSLVLFFDEDRNEAELLRLAACTTEAG